MECRVAGTRVRFHPLMLLLPLLAAALGLKTELAVTLISLMLHEAAHLIAARACGVRVEELRLMPFGGAALIGNVYALSPGRLFAVAAAGPVANLILILLSGALAQWGAASPAAALALTQPNLTLMLFNLLPALPLDGGRMLYALTAERLGRRRAVEVGLWMGRAVALGLVVLLVRGLVVERRFNLSLAACAVFLLASAPEERRALSELRASSPLNGLRDRARPIDMRLCAVAEECGLMSALRHAAPDAATLYAVYRDDALKGFTDERRLLEAALSNRDGTVAEAL